MLAYVDWIQNKLKDSLLAAKAEANLTLCLPPTVAEALPTSNKQHSMMAPTKSRRSLRQRKIIFPIDLSCWTICLAFFFDGSWHSSCHLAWDGGCSSIACPIEPYVACALTVIDATFCFALFGLLQVWHALSYKNKVVSYKKVVDPFFV